MKRFKNNVAQAQYEKALACSYPMSIEKDKVGGSFADAFNAGYEGKTGGIYRFLRLSPGYIFYQAGKERRKLDTKSPGKTTRALQSGGR